VSGPRSLDRITAITFDFWNTLYSANNGSMDAVRPRRQEALNNLLASCGVVVPSEALTDAYRLGFDAYVAAWNDGLHFGAREQVLFMLDHFHVSDTHFDETLVLETAKIIEDASLLAPLRLLPGAREAIPELAEAGIALGIISDTSLTPGRIMKEFLAEDELLDYFTALTFSDVTGVTKPNPRMFETTLRDLGSGPDSAAHVGDTPRTDIAGAQSMGMIAIRCAAAVDHQDPPEADFVITDHREITDMLKAQRGRASRT